VKKSGKISSYKVQSSVDAYTNFVLNGLVGSKGTSVSNVVSYIIKSWIENNDEQITSNKLTIADWKNWEEKNGS